MKFIVDQLFTFVQLMEHKPCSMSVKMLYCAAEMWLKIPVSEKGKAAVGINPVFSKLMGV